MKFMVIYRERRTDFDPAAAQRRAARMLNERTMPPGLKVRELVGRIGGGGGYVLVETADPDDLQVLAAMFAAYDCRIEPVIDIPFGGSRSAPPAEPASAAPSTRKTTLPEMPATEPHEGAFSDDDIYDTED